MCQTKRQSVKEESGPSTGKWVEINGERYDISKFKHPGGIVINFYANTDATDAFLNFHNAAILKNYAHLMMPAGTYKPIPVDPMITEYREFRQKLVERGFFKPQYSFFIGQAIISFIFFAVTFPLFFNGWWWTSLVCGAAAQVSFGWLMHDFGHRSVTTTRKGDTWWNSVVMQFFQGGSTNWWTSKHTRHHLLPNVLEHDPDIHTDPVFAWHDKMKSGFWNKYQHLYFPIIGPTLGVVFMNILVARYAIRHREWGSLVAILGFLCWWSFIFGPLHLFLMRVCQGLWFQWVVAVNHFGEIVHEKKETESMDWVHLVADTTVNVRGGWFLNWFTGHLNYQIEHHLFPRMPRVNYPKVAAETRAFFKKHNIHYGSYSPWVATKRLFESLANQGRESH